MEKVCYFHLYGVSLKAGHILATSASILSAPKANYSMLIGTSVDIFDCFDCCIFQVHLFQPGGTTKETTLNTMPVTNKLPEMEISRCFYVAK